MSMSTGFSINVGVKKDGRVYRLERVHHRLNSIYFISAGIPGGSHISVHDANEKHPFGIMHSRLSRGTFTLFPGGVDVGNTIGRVMIPPFQAITEPIPIGGGLSLGRINERSLHFANEMNAGKQCNSIVLDADALPDRFIGWFWLLLQPGDWSGTERWYRLRFTQFPGYRLESVHTWNARAPWLGLGFVSSPFETEGDIQQHQTGGKISGSSLGLGPEPGLSAEETRKLP